MYVDLVEFINEYRMLVEGTAEPIPSSYLDQRRTINFIEIGGLNLSVYLGSTVALTLASILA